MYIDVLPVRKYRLCLYCRKSFDSSSAAERVCPRCRRKHKKRLEKYGGVITFESTPQMRAHIDRIEQTYETAERAESIDALLSGDTNADDSFVYREILSVEETVVRKTAGPAVKAEPAVSVLSIVLEAINNVPEEKEKQPRLFTW